VREVGGDVAHLVAVGRAWRMRSWALRIFEAATISMAFVILRVFCTLLILVRISLLPAICGVLDEPFFLKSLMASLSFASSSLEGPWTIRCAA
jgi:hypothetical protein